MKNSKACSCVFFHQRGLSVDYMLTEVYLDFARIMILPGKQYKSERGAGSGGYMSVSDYKD